MSTFITRFTVNFQLSQTRELDLALRQLGAEVSKWPFGAESIQGTLAIKRDIFEQFGEDDCLTLRSVIHSLPGNVTIDAETFHTA